MKGELFGPGAAVLVFMLFPAGCATSGPSRAADAIAGIDSLTFEQHSCAPGPCRVVRLGISRSGSVNVRADSDPDRLSHGRIAGDAARGLMSEMDSIGFWRLPTVISNDPVLCSNRLLHGSTNVITVYGARAKRVEHYDGCHGSGSQGRSAPIPAELMSLRRFESGLHSIAAQVIAANDR